MTLKLPNGRQMWRIRQIIIHKICQNFDGNNEEIVHCLHRSLTYGKLTKYIYYFIRQLIQILPYHVGNFCIKLYPMMSIYNLRYPYIIIYEQTLNNNMKRKETLIFSFSLIQCLLFSSFFFGGILSRYFLGAHWVNPRVLI